MRWAVRRAWLGLAWLVACGPEASVAPPGHAEATAAVSSLGFAPGRERQVARLLAEAPLDEAAVREAVMAAGPTLDALDAASRAASWTVGAGEASRDAWEALAWLAYGDARLRLADGDAAGAFERALMVHRLGVLMGDAEGAEVSDVIVSFGLREAGLVQLQRLAALAPPDARRARRVAAAVADADAGLGAWPEALRALASRADERLGVAARDPVRALGPAGERLPPEARGAPDLFDVDATREAVVGLALRAGERGVRDCAAGLAAPQPSEPAPGPNLAGRIYARQTAAALGQLFDRVCATEAARRATVLALAHHAGVQARGETTDPFTGMPFARIGEALVSGGRGRVAPERVGTGPFDPERPTYFLDTRALVAF